MIPTTTRLPTAGQIDAICSEQNAMIKAAIERQRKTGQAQVAEVVDGSQEIFAHFLTTSTEYSELFGWALSGATLDGLPPLLRDTVAANALALMLAIGFKVAVLMCGQDEFDRMFAEKETAGAIDKTDGHGKQTADAARCRESDGCHRLREVLARAAQWIRSLGCC